MVRVFKHLTRTKGKLANFWYHVQSGQGDFTSNPQDWQRDPGGQRASVGRTGNPAAPLSPLRLGESSYSFTEVHCTVPAFCFWLPVTSWGVMGKKQNPVGPLLRNFSEQIRQDEARRFWFNTVDPEVGTAGMILVSSICQLETVGF